MNRKGAKDTEGAKKETNRESVEAFRRQENLEGDFRREEDGVRVLYLVRRQEAEAVVPGDPSGGGRATRGNRNRNRSRNRSRVPSSQGFFVW